MELIKNCIPFQNTHMMGDINPLKIIMSLATTSIVCSVYIQLVNYDCRLNQKIKVYSFGQPRPNLEACIFKRYGSCITHHTVSIFYIVHLPEQQAFLIFFPAYFLVQNLFSILLQRRWVLTS